MKKKILLIMLAVSLLVIAACTTDTGPVTGQGFVGGTKGVAIEFMTNTPPDRVADQGQETFDVVLELTNRGEHEVLKEDVFVKLEGFSATAFGKTPDQLIAYPDDDLYAIRKNPDGSVSPPVKIPVVFEGFNYQDDAPANIPFTFRAKACYKYETIALSNVCVKENFNDDREGDVCQVTGTKQVSNSGAPVQVTNIRQSAVGRDRTSITFSVQKMDTDQTGRVSRPDTGCDIQYQNENRVFVSVSGLLENPGDTINCPALREGDSSSGYVQISPSQATEVYCTVTLTDRSTRIHPFRITLGYDYSAYLDKEVVVVYTPE
jgi:hypothetical protein